MVDKEGLALSKCPAVLLSIRWICSPKTIGQALIVESVTTTPDTDQLMELGLVLDICWSFVVYDKELKVL